MASTDHIKTEQMDSDEIDPDWFGYECKSGEILFYYNIKTGEHRWRKHLSCSEVSLFITAVFIMSCIIHEHLDQSDGSHQSVTPMDLYTQ